MKRREFITVLEPQATPIGLLSAFATGLQNCQALPEPTLVNLTVIPSVSLAPHPQALQPLSMGPVQATPITLSKVRARLDTSIFAHLLNATTSTYSQWTPLRHCTLAWRELE